MIRDYIDIENFRKQTCLNKTKFCKDNGLNRGSYWYWSKGIKLPSQRVLSNLNKQLDKYNSLMKVGLTPKEITEIYEKVQKAPEFIKYGYHYSRPVKVEAFEKAMFVMAVIMLLLGVVLYVL